jgi:hypothetical protein
MATLGSGSATDCWVDLFELSHFRGSRRRFFGPGEWLALRSRAPDWGTQFDSIKVGPAAHVQIFQAGNDHPTVTFAPGQEVRDLLEHAVTDAHDSLRVLDHAPGAGAEGVREPARPA